LTDGYGNFAVPVRTETTAMASPNAPDPRPTPTCARCTAPLNLSRQRSLGRIDAAHLNSTIYFDTTILDCQDCHSLHMLASNPSHDDASCPHISPIDGSPDWHPMRMNSPWSQPVCRHCFSRDPAVYILDLLGQVISRNRAMAAIIDGLQGANTRYAQDNATLRHQRDTLQATHSTFVSSTNHERELWSERTRQLERDRAVMLPILQRLHQVWARREQIKWDEHSTTAEIIGFIREEMEALDLATNTGLYVGFRVIAAYALIGLEITGRNPVDAMTYLRSRDLDGVLL
jgi:hypothetical protein